MKVDKAPPAATCPQCREDDADGRGNFYHCCQEKLKDAAAGLFLHGQLLLHEGSCAGQPLVMVVPMVGDEEYLSPLIQHKLRR
ncbi:hypothetical protein Peur_004434 [Populus x canadensis]